jgi:tRNA splicing endonuclease
MSRREATPLDAVLEEIIALGASAHMGAPIAVHKSGDEFFVWDAADVTRLRIRGRLAVSAIGACPTKTSTRGKAAAVPVLLSDQELHVGASNGWWRVVDAASGQPCDLAAHLRAVAERDTSGRIVLHRLVSLDLWKMGYFLTNGIKFGCDYLAYRADPSMVHAAFMVVVATEGQGIAPLDLVARARVATTALKTCVMAWGDVASGTVRYAAFRRMGPGTAIFADSEAATAASASAAAATTAARRGTSSEQSQQNLPPQHPEWHNVPMPEAPLRDKALTGTAAASASAAAAQ